jgi:GNAT superfamily N-acetyltransferase
MAMAVRRVDPAGARDLAAFAEACFREAFGYLLPDQALDRLCRRAFAPEAMAALVGRCAWIAEGPAGCLGYAGLGAEPCPVAGLPDPCLQLARLYVAGPWQGRGVSGALMSACLGEARRRGARSLWLEAFEGSPRALGFYRRWGFQDLGGLQVRVQEGIHLPHRILGLALGRTGDGIS